VAEGGQTLRFETIAWEAALRRIRADGQDWIFASGIEGTRLAAIAEALEVPEATLRNRLVNSVLPRIDRLEKYTVIFVWYPAWKSRESSGDWVVERTPLLIVGCMENVVVLTREQTDLVERMHAGWEGLDPGLPTLLRLTHALLSAIVRRYAQLFERLETSMLEVENEQAALSDPAFLSRTFRLRGELSRMRGNVKHLEAVLGVLAEKPVAIRGFEVAERPLFALLADDAEEVYQGVDDLLDSLTALVDFRLNVASFQMNKVMRLLAVFTALALIPTIVGGLLGMNLADSPWPADLPQVAFGVGAGLALALYVFAVKGWLR
jgi:Mg2+ and Co2+ transporter CorA